MRCGNSCFLHPLHSWIRTGTTSKEQSNQLSNLIRFTVFLGFFFFPQGNENKCVDLQSPSLSKFNFGDGDAELFQLKKGSNKGCFLTISTSTEQKSLPPGPVKRLTSREGSSTFMKETLLSFI